MGAKTSTWAHDVLLLYFNGTGIADIADNDGTSPATQLFVSLHAQDPGTAGSRAHECDYTGYAEVAVVRDNTGWSVTGGTVNPAVPIDFPEKTGGTDQQAAYWAVARSAGGTIDYRGPINPPLDIVDGKVPRLKTTSAITED